MYFEKGKCVWGDEEVIGVHMGRALQHHWWGAGWHAVPPFYRVLHSTRKTYLTRSVGYVYKVAGYVMRMWGFHV
jgi:hypothetical protein